MIENVAIAKNVTVEKWIEFGEDVYESIYFNFKSRKEIIEELRKQKNEKTVFIIALYNKYEVDFEDFIHYLLRLRDVNVDYYYNAKGKLDLITLA